MRYFLALSSLVLGIILLILGGGQRTFLAGPASIDISATEIEMTGGAVISGSELAKVPGTPEISVSNTAGTLVLGNEVDVTAWAAGSGYTALTIDPEAKLVNGKQVAAGESAPESTVALAASDLWTAVAEGDGSATLKLTEQVMPWQAVMFVPAPQENAEAPVATATPFEFSWQQVRNTPWAGPLLTAGGLFTLLGLVLWLLFVDRDRRGLGPRRGRKGPLVGIRDSFKRKQKVAPVYEGKPVTDATAQMRSRAVKRGALGLTLVASLALAGCSAEYWPGGNDEAAAETQAALQTVKPQTVSEAQLGKIIESVSSAAITGDSALDAAALTERFADDALAQRTANYNIRKAVSDYQVVPPFIRNERLGYELVQQTEAWPRTLFVTVASADTAENAQAESLEGVESPSLALLLTQANAHSNYKVSRVVALRGGIEMPPAAPAAEGTAVLANDLATLKVTPQQVAELYAQVLVAGADSENAALFELTDDSVFASGGSAWVAAEQSRVADQEAEATFSVTAEAGNPPVALSTGTGGALVVTTVLEYRTVTAGDNSEITVSDTVAAVSDLEGTKGKIVQTVQHQLLFYVPKADSDEKIQMLGSSSEIIGASE